MISVWLVKCPSTRIPVSNRNRLRWWWLVIAGLGWEIAQEVKFGCSLFIAMADDVDTLTAVDVLIPEETYLEPSGDQLTTDLPQDQRRTSSYGIFDSLDGLFGAHVVPVKHTLRNKQAENIYDEISDEEELFVPPSKKDDSLLDGILGLFCLEPFCFGDVVNAQLASHWSELSEQQLSMFSAKLGKS